MIKQWGMVPWTPKDVEANTAAYPEHVRRGLVAVAEYADRRLYGSRRALVDLLAPGEKKPDWTTVSRNFQGKYENPEPFYREYVEGALKIIAADADKYVATPVARRIRQTLELCRDMHTMVAVFGGPGRSKTFVGQDFARSTPGAIYVDCPTVGGVGAFLLEIGSKINTGTVGMTLAALAGAIENNMDGRNIIVVDEVVRILPATANPHGPGVKCMNFLQRLHDTRGVSVAFLATDVFADTFKNPALIKYMAQMRRRIEYEYEIPPVSRAEVKLIVSSFVDEAPEPFLEYAMEVASGPGGVGPLFTYLRHARLLAEFHQEPIGAAHFDSAVTFCRARKE